MKTRVVQRSYTKIAQGWDMWLKKAFCYRNLKVHFIVFFRWTRPSCLVCHARQLSTCCARLKALFNSPSAEAWLCIGLIQAIRATGNLLPQTQKQSLVSSYICSVYDKRGIMCCLNSAFLLAKQFNISNFTVSPGSSPQILHPDVQLWLSCSRCRTTGTECNAPVWFLSLELAEAKLQDPQRCFNSAHVFQSWRSLIWFTLFYTTQ